MGIENLFFFDTIINKLEGEFVPVVNFIDVVISRKLLKAITKI